MKIIVNENEKGFLFKNSKLKGVLDAGVYCLLGKKEIEVVSMEREVYSEKCNLDKLLSLDCIKDKVDVVEVKEGKGVLRYVNGVFYELFTEGKYAFWKEWGENTFVEVDFSSKEAINLPQSIFSKIYSGFYKKVDVLPYKKAVLFIDGEFEKVLDSGVYYFWCKNRKIETYVVDTRINTFNVAGQELLTEDKVTLRIGYVGNYKIVDVAKMLSLVDDVEKYIYTKVQLLLREYVSSKKLDDILSLKEEMSSFVFKGLKAIENEISVQFTMGAVRDIILPGEIRDIMNTVLVAEKKAQANVIARREEVASTRSLLNTAKLMDENKTLYKLKELEYLERIFENVENITVSGNGDIISQLSSLIGKK